MKISAWVQTVNEMQPPARLTALEDTCHPVCSLRKEALSFSDAPVVLCTTKLSFSEPRLVNGRVQTVSTGQPWAHTSKTAASNRRVSLAPPGYICLGIYILGFSLLCLFIVGE